MNNFGDANARSAKEIFFDALEQPNAEARASFLDKACGKNPVLRQKIDKLLADHFEEDTFLKTAAFEAPPTVRESTPVTEGPGTRIDRYKLLQKLGEGGFGVVYMAEQKHPVKRRVAFKIIKLGMDTQQVVARFEAERQALAMMDHPNIAKVLDAGATDTGRPFFVMELVKGVPITKHCDDNSLTTRERLELFIPICQAIQHAHQKGIIHRDIKPSNVMITLHDGRPVPKVIDFGIAKATQAELTEKTIFTQYRQFIGTPAYMSPEQAEMSGLDIDTRSDIYSLGVLLYELLVGGTPLNANELMSGGYEAIRRRIREDEVPKPSTRVETMEGSEKTTVARHRKIGPDQLSGELRGDLDWIVLKALEKDRTRRYETANGFALDIQRFLKDEPVSAVAPSKGYLIHKYVRRHRTALAVAATIAGLLFFSATLSTWQAVRATRAQQMAEAAQSEAETERRNTEEARRREQALREEAVAGERRQRLSAYEADMRLAHRYLNENNLTMVKMLLDRYDQATNGVHDVRGLYWRHLNQVTHGDQSSSTLPHDSMVRSVSLSSDGTRLASCTLSGRVRLYQVTTSDDVNTVKLLWEHGGGFLAYGAAESTVAISPDGRLLAAEQQGTLMVWNTTTRELAFEKAHVRAPVVFSPDSKALVGVSESGVLVWNTSNWTARPLLDESPNLDTRQTSALIFTPEGKHVVFCPSQFADNLIICRLGTGLIEGNLVGLDRPAVLSSMGPLLAAGGRDGQVAVWNWPNRELLKIFKAHSSVVFGVALSPLGSTLATGGSDSVIHFWDTDSFKLKGNLRGHRGQVWNLKFPENGSYLASASIDQSVKIWKGMLLRESDPGSMSASFAQQPTHPAPDGEANGGGDSPQGPPTTHTILPGEDIQAAIAGANAGDRIELHSGVHPVTMPIIVTKPLTITGKTGVDGQETVLQCREGVPTAIQIATASSQITRLQDLTITTLANGIQHLSGELVLLRSDLTLRSSLDLYAALTLDAMTGNDSVTVEECALRVEYVGDTIEGTPPDIDVVIANPGTHYRNLVITNCRIENRIPNAIAHGIESRTTRAQVTILNNQVRCLGTGILLPNHQGRMEIRNNIVWGARGGIVVGSDEPEPSYISGNRVTVESQELEIYPVFVRSYSGRSGTACIRIGYTSAGITAGFFLQEVIGLAAHFRIENNVLTGNPDYGISMLDSPTPETFGPSTPNRSHDNILAGNDFTQLRSSLYDLGLGASTYANRIHDNVGLKKVYKEAGDQDRNQVELSEVSNTR